MVTPPARPVLLHPVRDERTGASTVVLPSPRAAPRLLAVGASVYAFARALRREDIQLRRSFR